EFLQQLPVFSNTRGSAQQEDIFKPLEVITMQELIQTHAGFDLTQYQSTPKLYEKAKELGLLSSSQAASDLQTTAGTRKSQNSTPGSPGSPGSSSSSAPITSSAVSYTWEELFNLIFISLAEPRIPSDRPVIIKDYPNKIRCLAKDRPGTPWSERWELYLHGTELANCYSEETDPIKVGEYFEEAAAALAAQRSFSNKAVPDIDLHYKDLYTDKHPPCSGTALGIDRLLMELTGIDDIGGVMLFPLTDRD
ncbi:MAG: hypothetical protein K9K78_06195, partial [Spirochaetales bacterium]|nr:hypothetical protein [Spirochaetales bacterium]